MGTQTSWRLLILRQIESLLAANPTLEIEMYFIIAHFQGNNVTPGKEG